MKIRTFTLFLACVLFLSACHTDYQIVQVTGTRHKIDASLDSTPHDLATEYLIRFQEEVRQIQAPILGVSTQQLEANRPESPLSNLTADILRKATLKYGGEPADIGIMNMGGLRSSLPEGNITVGDVYKVFPFENKLFTLSLTGEQLLNLFQCFAAVGGQGISGAQLVISKDGKLLKATINGETIEKSKVYRIATIDYLAEGNDGMSVLRKGIDRQLFDTLTLRQVVTEYIVEQTRNGEKIHSESDGRIQIKGAHLLPSSQERAKKEKKNGSTSRSTAQGSELSKESSSTIQPTDCSNISPSFSPKERGNETSITILHSSDTHSCIEPDAKTGLGGYVRRATFVEQVRKKNPQVLLADCGDFSQGSLYYNLFKGAVEVALMNVIGYDVATIGNHEFDFGLDNMMRIFAMAEFPIVSTNYDFTGTPVESFVRPYHITEVNGITIGFVGLGPQLEGLVAETNCKGVVYHDPIITADSVASFLKTEKHCDVIVCLSHLGWENDKQLIANTQHLDIVLGGHSHSYFQEPIYYKNIDNRDIMLMHIGKNGQYISETIVRFKKAKVQ